MGKRTVASFDPGTDGAPAPGNLALDGAVVKEDTTRKRDLRSDRAEVAASPAGARTLQSFVPDTLLAWLAEKAAAHVPSVSFCPAMEHLSGAVCFVDIRCVDVLHACEMRDAPNNRNDAGIIADC